MEPDKTLTMIRYRTLAHVAGTRGGALAGGTGPFTHTYLGVEPVVRSGMLPAVRSITAFTRRNAAPFSISARTLPGTVVFSAEIRAATHSDPDVAEISRHSLKELSKPIAGRINSSEDCAGPVRIWYNERTPTVSRTSFRKVRSIHSCNKIQYFIIWS
jgi:hypothetical protein